MFARLKQRTWGIAYVEYGDSTGAENLVPMRRAGWTYLSDPNSSDPIEPTRAGSA